jgi:hypothetical protein
VFLCVAAAFFHPVFYGVFMIGFCLWLMRLALAGGLKPRGRARASWLAYLATPIPFFLLYKLPYYGMASPPQVVHPMPGLGAVVAQVKALALVAPIFAALGGLGLLAARGGGPMAWVIGTSLLLRLAVRSPNPHWFTDLVHLFGAIASGLGAAWLARRWGAAGKGATALLLATGAVAFGLHLRGALEVGHTFSADEQAAAGWLRDNSEPGDAIAIHPNSPSSFTVLGLSQRRVLHGWTTHQLDFFHDAREREKEVSEIYTTPDPSRASGLARRLGVQYLYVGPTERACCGRQGLSEMCFPPVFSSGDVEIRRFACAALDIAAAPDMAAAQ